VEAAQALVDSVIQQIIAIGYDPTPEPAPEPEPVPEPEPIQPIQPIVTGNLPVPPHDVDSEAWQRWVATVEKRGGSAYEHALIAVVTGDPMECGLAAKASQETVDVDNVAGNQYLRAGVRYAGVFATIAWCDIPLDQAEEWIEWGEGHLGGVLVDGELRFDEATVGRKGIWWSNGGNSKRWSRDNPANNYYHSFATATTYYAIVAEDEVWLDFMRNDRLPLMYDYYATTPEGGSREGTGYGESHRSVFDLAYVWRHYDGTEVLPQEFIDGSLRYWVHATTPGGQSLALMGDQTRAKGRFDGKHCGLLDSALHLARDPKAAQMARWQLGRANCFGSHVFRKLVLEDYPAIPQPDMPLDYYAKGAGVLFVRESWDDDAAYAYFTAGIRDEAHQCEDQGGFAVWDDGQWQTVADHPWTQYGICSVKPVEGARLATQNVLRFPGVEAERR